MVGRIVAAREAIAATVAGLRDAAVPPDPLAELVAGRRVLGIFPRADRLRRTGDAWRLGALLLTPDGRVLVGAETTRAKRPERVGYSAESARARDALRHAAFRGRFVEGVTVHVGGRAVDLDALDDDAGQLVLRDDAVAVRWAPGTPASAATPLHEYLAERADLLIRPPEGA